MSGPTSADDRGPMQMEDWLNLAARMNGTLAGEWLPEEYRPLLAAGYLRKSYEGGAAGFMGLARLRLTADAQHALTRAQGGPDHGG